MHAYKCMFLYIIFFLMQRNCHRNIHNQFSRGLSLHCSWQQDWYHGCGKSETAGQDNAGNKVAEWLLKSHNFSFLDAVLLPNTMYTLYIMKPFFVKCVLLPRNLVSGVRACGWLWPSTVSMAPAESSLDGSLQAYLKNPTILSHVFMSPPDSFWKSTVHLNGRDYADAGL